jgi:hypothetical protein
MKLKYPKEWYESRIDLEGDAEIGAGIPPGVKMKTMARSNVMPIDMIRQQKRNVKSSMALKLKKAGVRPKKLLPQKDARLQKGAAIQEMARTDQHYVDFIIRSFDRIKEEVEGLFYLTRRKRSGLIFHMYHYSVEDLWKHPHFKKNFSLSGRLASTVNEWYVAGKLPVVALQTYRREQRRLAKSLIEVKIAIVNREQNVLEQIPAAFKQLTAIILRATGGSKKSLAKR